MTEQEIADRLNIKSGELIPESSELVHQIKILIDEVLVGKVAALKIKDGDDFDFELHDDPRGNCYYAYNCAVDDAVRLLKG